LRWLGFDSLLDPDAEGWGNTSGGLGVRKRAVVVNQEVLRWLDHSPTRPFFAFLNYFDVHGPYGVPKSYPPPPWPQSGEKNLYDTGIRYVDDHLGQLLDGLKQRGLLDNTLVVITSDHGEGLWQHGLPTHGRNLYRELIHVPLIFWYPGHIQAGVRVQAPVSNASIASTVIELSGSNSPSPFPQPTLSPLWRTPVPNWPPPVSELAQNRFEDGQDRAARQENPTSITGSMKSLVTPDWHLIVHSVAGQQLFDWAHDPGESQDMIHTAQGQRVATALSSQLQTILAGAPPPATANISPQDQPARPPSH